MLKRSLIAGKVSMIVSLLEYYRGLGLIIFALLVILPPSAYEKLSQLGSSDTMEVTESHPWVFRLSNPDDGDLFVYAGARDFQADEGCVILPDWVSILSQEALLKH
jgi:hypothetical protein